MKAFILAGGEGKRLLPYTSILPKPLLPINNKPILEYIIEKLKKNGIKDIVLATNYKSSMLKLFFGDGKKWGVNIFYSNEEKTFGTIGPLVVAKDYFTSDFIVMNGDVLTDINFKELAKIHIESGADITVVTKKHEILLDYGMIKLDGEKVVGWEEKPKLHTDISVGIYVLNPRVIKHIPKEGFFDMPELVMKIIEGGGKVKRFQHDGKWIDVGRVYDFEKAQEEMLEDFSE